MSTREEALAALAGTDWSAGTVTEGAGTRAKVTVSARIDPDEAAVLASEADRRGINPSVLFREILSAWVIQQRGDGAKPVTISPAELHAALDQVLRDGRRRVA
jgi:hypothetical protein